MTRNCQWPVSPLQAAGKACDLLTAPPSPLGFDGRGFAGLPERELDIPQLQRSLLSSAMTAAQRDAVWRELVVRARCDEDEGQIWTLIVVRLALPGLTKIAAGLRHQWRGEVEDLDAEVLAGFLLRLRTIDLAGPWVLGRLLNAASRAGRRACVKADAMDGELPLLPELVSGERVAAWGRPAGHPDAVLVQAVAAGVLDRTEARLIGVTRLEDVPLVDAAAALGLAPRRASTWRQTSEARLARAIEDGALEFVRFGRSALGTPLAARGRAVPAGRRRGGLGLDVPRR